MTRGPPTYPDAPLAGPRGRSTRSVLAPRPFSRALGAGVAAELLIGALDLAFGTDVIVAATLVLPPLVVALAGRWGDTVAVSGVAMCFAVLSALWHGGSEDWDFLLALGLVPAGGAVAIAVALVRTGTAVALERFRLLTGVAEAADVWPGPEAFAGALLELLVPRLADVCAVDVEPGAERRRLAVRGDLSLVPALDAGSLSPGAVLSLPLRARGRVFGSLSCALGSSRRRYSEADARFAEVLAGRVALALDNAGLTSELSVAEEQLGAVVRTLAEAVTVTNPEGRIVYANDAAVDLLRVESVDELLAAEPGDIMARFEVYDEAGNPVDLRSLPGFRVLSGERDVPPLLVRNVVVATGEERWLLNKVSSLHDVSGRLTRVVNVIEDVTEVKRAERAQSLLAAAGEVLAASLDYGETLQRVADVAVPALADRVSVEVSARGGRIERAAVAGGPAVADEAALARIRDAVIHGGPSELTASLMVVPMQAGSETLGALSFANADGRRFGRADLELAQELGRRAGVAVMNARVYSRRGVITHALESGLLPPELPEVPGWSSAVLYEPAGELTEVGGDFYDVFRGPDGWMLVIGDMAGQGAEAAARTSLARFTVRTAAEITGDVGRALSQLNDTLRGQAGVSLCTAVCAALSERADGTAALTMASAGHPPPLLVRGGAVSEMGEPGTLAGAFDGERWPAAVVELRPGDVLVFYTDGVLDAVGEADRFGEARLRRALGAITGSVEQRVAGLHAELQRFQRGPQRDDMTALVMRYGVSASPRAAAPPRR